MGRRKHSSKEKLSCFLQLDVGKSLAVIDGKHRRIYGGGATAPPPWPRNNMGWYYQPDPPPTPCSNLIHWGIGLAHPPGKILDPPMTKNYIIMLATNR